MKNKTLKLKFNNILITGYKKIHSETSDSRPHISSDTISETPYHDCNISMLQSEQHDTMLQDSE